MPRIADIVIITAGAGTSEEIMAADRVLDDLDQGLEVEAEHLGKEAGCRIGAPGHRARHRSVKCILQALVELTPRETLEIGHLSSGDIDDLDEFTGAHRVGPRGSALDADFLQGI